MRQHIGSNTKYTPQRVLVKWLPPETIAWKRQQRQGLAGIIRTFYANGTAKCLLISWPVVGRGSCDSKVADASIVLLSLCYVSLILRLIDLDFKFASLDYDHQVLQFKPELDSLDTVASEVQVGFDLSLIGMPGTEPELL